MPCGAPARVKDVEVDAEWNAHDSRDAGSSKFALGERAARHGNVAQAVDPAGITVQEGVHQAPRRRCLLPQRNDDALEVTVVHVDPRHVQAARGNPGEPRHQSRASHLDHVRLFAAQDPSARLHRKHEPVGWLARHARAPQFVSTRPWRVDDAVLGARHQQDLPQVGMRPDVPRLFLQVGPDAAAGVAVELGDVGDREGPGRSRATVDARTKGSITSGTERRGPRQQSTLHLG